MITKIQAIQIWRRTVNFYAEWLLFKQRLGIDHPEQETLYSFGVSDTASPEKMAAFLEILTKSTRLFALSWVNSYVNTDRVTHNFYH